MIAPLREFRTRNTRYTVTCLGFGVLGVTRAPASVYSPPEADALHGTPWERRFTALGMRDTPDGRVVFESPHGPITTSPVVAEG